MDSSRVVEPALREAAASPSSASDPAADGAPAAAPHAPVPPPITSPATSPATWTQPQPEEMAQQSAPVKRHRSGGLRLALRWILAGFKRLMTLAIAFVAIVMGLVTWDYYVTAPWTRDGRVRVQVASLAPQVSGQITELRVGDNQYVHKGDVLYVIDPFDFEVALRVDKAQAQQRAADLQVKQVQSGRSMCRLVSS